MINRKIIARKYAKAFLNIYMADISMETFYAIQKLSHFFGTHRKVLFYLGIPNISREKKAELLNELIEKFHLLANCTASQ